jgi:hypothetical protein
MREPRLGDDIDDFCVRCKRVMNHSVVSVVNQEPAKVRCRICHSDHDFRHEQPPPPKVDLRKQALFNEVLKKVEPGEGSEIAEAAPVDASAEAAPVDASAEAAPVDGSAEAAPVDGSTEAAPVDGSAEPAAVPDPPKSKSKAKPRK